MASPHVAKGSLSRVLAAEVVMEVTERGAFVAAELDRRLLLHPGMDARDVALTTELAYGTVRTAAVLEERLAEVANRGVKSAELRAHLLVGAYQLLVLDRVPAFAAVDVAVEQAKRIGGQKLGGFANAVLRRLASGPRLERREALRQSVPSWLRQSVESVVGADQAAALFGFDEQAPEPRTTVRFRGAALPEWAEQGTVGRHLDSVRTFRRGGDLRRHPEWQRGEFVVQEEGATLAGLALGARPGERVYDACAGRGQKASLLADAITASGELWVGDKTPGKLARLISEFERLNLPRPNVYVAGADDSELPRNFDRILVDAPCSGSGTLRHRPEIARRLSEADPPRLGRTSLELLNRAATLLRPGGSLLFVVCSVLAEECERVVEQVVGVEAAPFEPSPFSALAGDRAQTFRLLPGLHGTDGFFLAAFRKPS